MESYGNATLLQVYQHYELDRVGRNSIFTQLAQKIDTQTSFELRSAQYSLGTQDVDQIRTGNIHLVRRGFVL